MYINTDENSSDVEVIGVQKLMTYNTVIPLSEMR